MPAIIRGTAVQRDALERLFDLAEGYSGGSYRARRLLCAWWNGGELGGFDLADLWSFDDVHRRAAVVVITWIAELPQGTYADGIEGFRDRARALGRRRAEELATAKEPAE